MNFTDYCLSKKDLKLDDEIDTLIIGNVKILVHSKFVSLHSEYAKTYFENKEKFGSNDSEDIGIKESIIRDAILSIYTGKYTCPNDFEEMIHYHMIFDYLMVPEAKRRMTNYIISEIHEDCGEREIRRDYVRSILNVQKEYNAPNGMAIKEFYGENIIYLNDEEGISKKIKEISKKINPMIFGRFFNPKDIIRDIKYHTYSCGWQSFMDGMIKHCNINHPDVIKYAIKKYICWSPRLSKHEDYLMNIDYSSTISSFEYSPISSMSINSESGF